MNRANAAALAVSGLGGCPALPPVSRSWNPRGPTPPRPPWPQAATRSRPPPARRPSRRHRRGTCSPAIIAMRATADAYISRSFPVYPNKHCAGTSAPRTDGRTASLSRKLAATFNWPRKRINPPDDFPL